MNEARKKYVYNGKTVYEWEQNLEEVLLFIQSPAGVRAKDLSIVFSPHHLKVGIKGYPLYIDEDLTGVCVVSNSLWMLEDDGMVSITLHKSAVGETWISAFKGHTEMDPFSIQEEQKRLMKERLSRENPGFDFSNATFSGNAPDPKTFMGGINTSKLK